MGELVWGKGWGAGGLTASRENFRSVPLSVNITTAAEEEKEEEGEGPKRGGNGTHL